MCIQYKLMISGSNKIVQSISVIKSQVCFISLFSSYVIYLGDVTFHFIFVILLSKICKLLLIHIQWIGCLYSV